MSKKTEALEVILGLMPNAKFIDKDGKDITEDVKKSHNTEENEQETHKNLTELWKKGELESGWYYTQVGGFKEVSPDLYDKDDNSWLCDSDKDLHPLEVLAPVPSYEQWQSLNELLDSMQDTNKALANRLNICKNLLKEAKEKFVNLDYAKGLIRRIDEVLK